MKTAFTSFTALYSTDLQNSRVKHEAFNKLHQVSPKPLGVKLGEPS